MNQKVRAFYKNLPFIDLFYIINLSLTPIFINFGSVDNFYDPILIIKFVSTSFTFFFFPGFFFLYKVGFYYDIQKLLVYCFVISILFILSIYIVQIYVNLPLIFLLMIPWIYSIIYRIKNEDFRFQCFKLELKIDIYDYSLMLLILLVLLFTFSIQLIGFPFPRGDGWVHIQWTKMVDLEYTNAFSQYAVFFHYIISLCTDFSNISLSFFLFYSSFYSAFEILAFKLFVDKLLEFLNYQHGRKRISVVATSAYFVISGFGGIISFLALFIIPNSIIEYYSSIGNFIQNIGSLTYDIWIGPTNLPRYFYPATLSLIFLFFSLSILLDARFSDRKIAYLAILTSLIIQLHVIEGLFILLPTIILTLFFKYIKSDISSQSDFSINFKSYLKDVMIFFCLEILFFYFIESLTFFQISGNNSYSFIIQKEKIDQFFIIDITSQIFHNFFVKFFLNNPLFTIKNSIFYTLLFYYNIGLIISLPLSFQFFKSLKTYIDSKFSQKHISYYLTSIYGILILYWTVNILNFNSNTFEIYFYPISFGFLLFFSLGQFKKFKLNSSSSAFLIYIITLLIVEVVILRVFIIPRTSEQANILIRIVNYTKIPLSVTFSFGFLSLIEIVKEYINPNKVMLPRALGSLNKGLISIFIITIYFISFLSPIAFHLYISQKEEYLLTSDEYQSLQWLEDNLDANSKILTFNEKIGGALNTIFSFDTYTRDTWNLSNYDIRYEILRSTNPKIVWNYFLELSPKFLLISRNDDKITSNSYLSYLLGILPLIHSDSGIELYEVKTWLKTSDVTIIKPNSFIVNNFTNSLSLINYYQIYTLITFTYGIPKYCINLEEIFDINTNIIVYSNYHLNLYNKSEWDSIYQENKKFIFFDLKSLEDQIYIPTTLENNRTIEINSIEYNNLSFSFSTPQWLSIPNILDDETKSNFCGSFVSTDNEKVPGLVVEENIKNSTLIYLNNYLELMQSTNNNYFNLLKVYSSSLANILPSEENIDHYYPKRLSLRRKNTYTLGIEEINFTTKYFFFDELNTNDTISFNRNKPTLIRITSKSTPNITIELLNGTVKEIGITRNTYLLVSGTLITTGISKVELMDSNEFLWNLSNINIIPLDQKLKIITNNEINNFQTDLIHINSSCSIIIDRLNIDIESADISSIAFKGFDGFLGEPIERNNRTVLLTSQDTISLKYPWSKFMVVSSITISEDYSFQDLTSLSKKEKIFSVILEEMSILLFAKIILFPSLLILYGILVIYLKKRVIAFQNY